MTARPLFLGGRWVASPSTIAVVNPATTEVIAEVATVSGVRVGEAVDDAHRAFLPWRQLTGAERGRRLSAFAEELLAQREEIARTITLENGKPLAQARAEVAMAADHFQWFAEEARRAYGRVIPPQAPNKRHLVVKSPIGVVAAISPWNFPLVLAARKIAPALAAGCTVVLKPASQTPLSALALARCAEAADLPAGVLQVVVGAASEIGRAFFEHPLCRKVTFTGSTEVGRALIRQAADRLKPLSLELGGHAPLIVFEDADLAATVDGALIAKFRNSGQSCIASNRLYVQRPILSAFLERFVARVRGLKVADGLEDGCDVGPLINEAAVTHALAHVDDAVRRGAELRCGGRRLARKGFFLEATVLAAVPDDAACMREETFAPVAVVCPFDTEAEVLRRANDSDYGLAAYVFTRDLARALRMMDALEAGTIGINDAVPSTSQCPFGGLKQSGWGRELGTEGMEAFLETKHASIGGVDSTVS